MYFIGDSHATQHLDSLVDLAPGDDFRVISLTRSCCPIFKSERLKKLKLECRNWFDSVWSLLQENQNLNVVISNLTLKTQIAIEPYVNTSGYQEVVFGALQSLAKDHNFIYIF